MKPIKLLAVSDIHKRVDCVRRLRTQETVNDFDAVVVAGDIGSDAADEIFTILASFDAPVLYIYGNWDGALAYDRTFPGDSRHIHHNPVRIGDWTFVGFSGLLTGGWGQNPIARTLYAQAGERDRVAVRELHRLEAEAETASTAAAITYAEGLAALDAQIEDRKSLPYRSARSRLSSVRFHAQASAKAIPQKFEQEAQRAYTATKKIILDRNRAELARIVNGVEAERCIVVTHERIYRTQELMPRVPLYLFGHIHGFADKKTQGSRFVNVSALDTRVSMTPPGKPYRNESRAVEIGSYVVIEIDEHRNIRVRSRQFEPPAGWVRRQQMWPHETAPPPFVPNAQEQPTAT